MAEFEEKLEDTFDEELNRALRTFHAVTPPQGMESRVLERAETFTASPQSPSGMRWLSLAQPLGALAVAAIIVVALHHRSEIGSARTPEEATIASTLIPATQTPEPQPPVAIGHRSGPAMAPRMQTHLPAAVLGGPLTQEELLLLQMSAQTEEHPELKEMLDPELRYKDLAQVQQDFQDFLNSGSKTGDETP